MSSAAFARDKLLQDELEYIFDVCMFSDRSLNEHARTWCTNPTRDASGYSLVNGYRCYEHERSPAPAPDLRDLRGNAAPPDQEYERCCLSGLRCRGGRPAQGACSGPGGVPAAKAASRGSGNHGHAGGRWHALWLERLPPISVPGMRPAAGGRRRVLRPLRPQPEHRANGIDPPRTSPSSLDHGIVAGMAPGTVRGVSAHLPGTGLVGGPRRGRTAHGAGALAAVFLPHRLSPG